MLIKIKINKYKNKILVIHFNHKDSLQFQIKNKQQRLKNHKLKAFKKSQILNRKTI